MPKTQENKDPQAARREATTFTETPGPDYSCEEDEGLYGWQFHKIPLIGAIILTILFYIFVFLWVD